MYSDTIPCIATDGIRGTTATTVGDQKTRYDYVAGL
jgi:hypothetical protein